MAVETLVTIITDAGRAAAIDAAAQGLTVRITHLAIGDSPDAPTPAMTALGHERLRTEILSGMAIDPATLQVTGIIETALEITVREIGFVLADGTLFAVAHRPLGIIETRPWVAYPIGLVLPLVSLPAGAVTITAELNLDLAFAGPIATLTAAVFDLARRQVQQELRLRRLEGRYTAGMAALAYYEGI